MVKVSKELVGASAIKIILSVLAQGDNYGYEILQKVKELSGGRIKWNEGEHLSRPEGRWKPRG